MKLYDEQLGQCLGKSSRSVTAQVVEEIGRLSPILFHGTAGRR
jgi:hypothetical protein